MAPYSLQYPHVDILKLFAKRKWSDAHAQGDVQQVIDKTIGKRVFALQGTISAANTLALPRSGLPGLGLGGRYLYLQLQLQLGQPFTLHIDLLTDRK